jgi:hypothetical protein
MGLQRMWRQGPDWLKKLGWGLHITPTKHTMEGSVSSTKKFLQSWCQSCDAKTIMVCSACRRDPEIGKIGQRFVTHCQARCATASIWTNHIDFELTKSLICVSFTCYSNSVLSCFDLYLQILDRVDCTCLKILSY